MLHTVPLPLEPRNERGTPGTMVVRSVAWAWVTAPVMDAGIGLWVLECENAPGVWGPPFKCAYPANKRRVFRGIKGLMDGGQTVLGKPDGALRAVLVRWDITPRQARALDPAQIEPLCSAHSPQVRLAAISALGWAGEGRAAGGAPESATLKRPTTRSTP
jgi:hypothetical protein